MSDSVSRPLRVFLCHSSGDKPTVRELYQRLDSEGWIDAWLDTEKLYPGQDWNLEIEKAVEAADIIVVCLTNNSVTKEGYVQRELRMVLDLADYKPEGTLFIIPVRLEECDPPRRLRTWHYADYFPQNDRDRAYGRLLVSLRNRAKALGIISEKSEAKPISPSSTAASAQQSAPKVVNSAEPKVGPAKDGINNLLDLQISEIMRDPKLSNNKKVTRLVSLFFTDLQPKLDKLYEKQQQELNAFEQTPERFNEIWDWVGNLGAPFEFEEQEFQKFKASIRSRFGDFLIGKSWFDDRSKFDVAFDDERIRQGNARRKKLSRGEKL